MSGACHTLAGPVDVLLQQQSLHASDEDSFRFLCLVAVAAVLCVDVTDSCY
jgi:hypothetical protein